jgi:RHS repeat-associated protein
MSGFHSVSNNRDGLVMHTEGFSSFPVRYANGEAKVVVEDLPALFGMRWFGHTRSYNNTYAQKSEEGMGAKGQNGINWYLQQWPYMWRSLDGEIDFTLQPFVIVLPPNEMYQFEPDGMGGYQSTPTPFVDRVTLTHDTTNHVYHLVVRDERLDFRDYDGFSDPSGRLPGALVSYTAPSGAQVQTISYNSNSQLEEIQLTFPNSSTVYSITYHYTAIGYSSTNYGDEHSGSATISQLDTAQLRVSNDAGSSFTPIRQVVYNYYDATTGAESDSDTSTVGFVYSALRYAAVQIPNGDPTSSEWIASPSWTEVGRSYYRYYPHFNLKLVLGQEGYRRLLADLGSSSSSPQSDASDPTQCSDDTIRKYADHYFEYNDTDEEFGDPLPEVTYEEAAGSGGNGGCASCGGGSSTPDFGDTYEYYSRTTSGSDSNIWANRTTVTHADENKDIVYTNTYGQPMVKIFEEEPSAANGYTTRRWGIYYQYDSRGHLTLQAEPSAVSLPSDLTDMESNDGLIVDSTSAYEYLNTNGLIHIFTYYQDSDGAVSGELEYESVQQGKSGTPDKIRFYQYTTHSYTDSTLGTTLNVNRLLSITEYPNAGETFGAQTTSYSYTLYSSSTQVQQLTITLPSVSVWSDGSGSSDTIVQYFDKLGNLIWQKDQRGFITRSYYTTTSGSDILYAGMMQKHIDDASMSALSSDPTDSVFNPSIPSWSTPSGGGLHLITDYAYDTSNRLTQVLGPSHVADVSGTPTTLRSANWNVYNESSIGDQIWTCRGYATGSSGSYTFTSLGPVEISMLNKDGSVADSILAVRSTTSGALSASDSFPQSGWQRWTASQYDTKRQLTATQLYHSIPTTSGALGSFGTNYDETDYGYDIMGRRERVKSPGGVGSVTRFVFDPEGRVTATWKGTNDVPSDGTSSPVCWCDWPAHSASVDLVEVSSDEYDSGSDGGDSTLTTMTQYQDGSTTRVWTYGYDFRDRRQTTTGPVNFCSGCSYDNLDRLEVEDRFDTNTSGNLIAERKVSYDELDRVCNTMTTSVNPSNGERGNTLQGYIWYDPCGNIMKTNREGVGAIFNKTEYDGVGRAIKQYVSYDLSEDDTDYSAASNVTGDTVVSQSEVTYDAAGNIVQTTQRDRLETSTSTGDLASDTARVKSSVAWYDAINRPILSADFGIGSDGSNYSTATSPSIPSASDSILVTLTAYDTAGMPYQTTDPKGIVKQTTYDQAGRTQAILEDYSTGSGHLNRETDYTYTPDNLISTITAINTGSVDQTTTYVYGSTTTESGVASSTLLRAIIYPDSDDMASPLNNSASPTLGNGTDSTYNRVELEYNRLGEIIQRKDNNQSIHQYNYDGLGRLVDDRVTSLGSGVDPTVKRISRTYEVRGMLSGIKSYDNATVGCGTVLNDDELTYNSFGQLVTDQQSHSGTVNTSTSPKTQYTYDDGSLNEVRPTSLTYPNGRVVYYNYNDAGDTAGTSAAINRIAAICSSSTRGTSDSNVIASYDYVGLNRAVAETYPTPVMQLSYNTDGTYSGWDAFDRIIQQDWTSIRIEAFGLLPPDYFDLNHAYDRNSNRISATNLSAYQNDSAVYDGSSHAYTYDHLNRLTADTKGLAATDGSIQSFWQDGGSDWSLDLLGNQTAVKSSYITNTADKANKYTARAVIGNSAPTEMSVSDPFTSDTSSNWQCPSGSGAAFSIDASAHKLTINTVAVDTFANGRTSYTIPEARATVIWGGSMGPTLCGANVTFPSGATTGQAGWIYGYKSISDYWVRLYDIGSQTMCVYQVENGTKTLISSSSTTVSTGTAYPLHAASTRGESLYPWGVSYDDGCPSGKVGVFSNITGVKFDSPNVQDAIPATPLLGRWDSHGGLAVNASNNSLAAFSDADWNLRPTYVKNLRLQQFQATFSMTRLISGSFAQVGFVFNGKDRDDYDFILLFADDTADTPYGYQIINGQQSTILLGSTGSPTCGMTDVMWSRVQFDGTTLKVWQIVKSDGTTPTETDWSSATQVVNTTSCRTTGGRLGFLDGTVGGNGSNFSNLSLKSYNGSAWVTEATDDFAVNSSTGYATSNTTLSSDANGNQTYDGAQAYTYDAWNRLITVSHAYGTGSNVGQVAVTMAYDGRGRRITKIVNNTGAWDCTYNYYLDKDSVIEEQNGSAQTIKQFVWGARYIDELLQVSINSAPSSQSTCDTPYWVCQDANWNVLGIVDSDGIVRERYEYSPYGERTVFMSAGSDDPYCMSPTIGSQRVIADDSTQPYGICEVGHQGLLHDEECGLVYNRGRYLSPATGRFLSHDLLGYLDSVNLYQYARDNPVRFTDPSGAGVDVPVAIIEAAAALAARGFSAAVIAEKLAEEFGADTYDFAKIASDAVSSNEALELEQAVEDTSPAVSDAIQNSKVRSQLSDDVFKKLTDFIRSIGAKTTCPSSLPNGITPQQAQKYLDTLKAMQAVAKNGMTNPVVINRIAQLEKLIQAALNAGG